MKKKSINSQKLVVADLDPANLNLFTCLLCPFKSKTKGNLYQHIRRHTGEKAYKCKFPGCQAAFSHSSALKSHRWVHVEEKTFECLTCKKKLKTQGNLRTHMKKHQPRKTPLLPCSLCPHQALTKHNLANHIKIVHSEDRPFQCPDCPYAAKVKNHLKRHSLIHQQGSIECPFCPCKFHETEKLENHLMSHTGEKPVACHLCEYRTTNLKNLKVHLNYRHERKFPCTKCNFFGMSRSILKNHERIHTGEKPFKCPHPNCSRSFRDMELLKSHKVVHSDEKNFQCSICNMKFKWKNGLKIHEKIHVKDKSFSLSCSFCSFQTIHKKSLKFHIIARHADKLNPKEQLIYNCSYCSYNTRIKDRLTNHLAIHPETIQSQKEKRFKCSFCQVRFRTKSQLFGHLRVHTGEKPYKCKFDSCPLEFRTSEKLRLHQVVHTNEKNFECFTCHRKMNLRSNWLKHLKIHQSQSNCLDKNKEIDGSSSVDKLTCRNRCTIGECKVLLINEKQLVLHLNVCHNLPRIQLEKTMKTERVTFL